MWIIYYYIYYMEIKFSSGVICLEINMSREKNYLKRERWYLHTLDKMKNDGPYGVTARGSITYSNS